MSTAKRKPRVLVTSIAYGTLFPQPLEILEEAGVEAIIHETDRTITEDDLVSLIGGGFDAMIAGLEPVTARAMDAAPDLKLIARVGIGFSNVDILAARERGIVVTYTPDGPSPPVGEMTIGMMIDVLRSMSRADRNLRRGQWIRYVGRRLADCQVGIIGVGRIGKTVIRHLVNGFPGVRILGNDLEPDREFGKEYGFEWADKETIYRTCDIISVHVPLTPLTRDLITARELSMMQTTARLINTARGGIINEADLAETLRSDQIAGAVLDVFDVEPYEGELTELENCLFTCHMAGSTVDARFQVETGAAEEIKNFALDRPYANPIPEVEYAMAAEALVGAERAAQIG